MEATYDKNNTNSTFDNDSAHFKLSNMDGGLNLSSDMLEGNELEEQQVISSPTITKNNYNESNHVLISDKSTDVVDHHQRFVDDFGPETDVDAMDDPNTIKSPMEQQANDSINEYNLCNGVKPFSLENKIIQQLSEQNRDFLSDSNPFKNDHFDQFSDDHLMLEDTIENNHSPSEVVDNKIIDALESAVSNGDQEQYELDSEKQMETTLDASQKTSEIPDVTEKVDLMHEKTSFTLDDAFGEHPENPFNQPVNEEAALFEQACVEESVGEDTEEEEDEWNYIKADKKSEENLQRSEILDSHSSDEAELARKQSSQGSERSESVPVLAELPELNIAYDSQLPDSPLVDSVEKKDTLEEEKDEKIVGVSAPVDEISDNIVPEESYSAGYTSVEQSRIQQELADIEIGPPIATPSAVTLDPLEDIHHTPLSEDPSVEVEQNLSEEKVTEFLSEDKNIVEIATEPSVELVAKDTSSLEVLTGDTLSTDVELEQEPENVEQTIALLDNEEPVTKQIDKELQLTIESKTSADVERVRPDSLSLEMASKLNPEAKEFVPISSPTRSNPTSPVANAPSMLPNSYLMLDDDTVVAQSPKKCSTTMDNIDVPEEDAFQHEMNNRPHELEKPSEYVNGSAEISARSHSPASEPSYQELNLKEAMQADEKLEHDYNDEKQVVPEDSPSELSNEQNILHVLNKEQDPMNMSFYEGRDEALLGNSDELNKVHVLPEEEDDEQPNEDDDKIQADDCVVSAHDGKPSDDKGEIVEPETASHTTLEEEQYDESKPTVHEEPSAPIFAVASQVVNDVAALVDQMQIETPILNAYHDLETKEDETVELENILPETEDVTMEQSNDILIRLENQSESKPLEDAVVEEHTESPHITTADYDAITHTAETDELVSPLVEFVQHEIVAENEFITDESVLNELSPSQRVFSAEAPVDYEPLVEEPAKELATPTVVDSVPTGNENSVPSIEPAATNLSDTVIPASEREVKLSEEPKLAVIAPKSATHKTTATSKSAATTKHTAMKTASKPSALTTDKKASVSAKVPSKSIPAKSSIAPKPSTAASTMKKTTTVSHASTATSSKTVGTAKPSTASSITRTSLTGTSTNKSMVTEKKAPLLAKKPVTTAVNGDVKTTIARKPLTSSTLKTTAATKITTTPSSSTSVPNARLSGTSVKSTLAKPLTATTKTSTSAPAKPSSAATRTPATALAAKPRTAPSTASKTASATSTSTMTSKTSQGSSSAVTKRVSTAATVATTRTTTASKTATTATKASSVTSRTSTVSKLSSSSATSTVRKATAASPTKKAVSSPASKTSTKTSTSTGKTITSTKTVVSSHANDVKDPLIEDSISSDLLNLDKQLKNDNNQLITKNGIDSQMMVIDSAAD